MLGARFSRSMIWETLARPTPPSREVLPHRRERSHGSRQIRLVHPILLQGAHRATYLGNALLSGGDPILQIRQPGRGRRGSARPDESLHLRRASPQVLLDLPSLAIEAIDPILQVGSGPLENLRQQCPVGAHAADPLDHELLDLPCRKRFRRT
jgi:hypothetical protein